MLFGPQRHPCWPFGLGILPSRASQYKSTGSSLTASHGLLPITRRSFEPLSIEADGPEVPEVEAAGAGTSTGTILPDRVEPWAAGAAAAGVAVPESCREERAEGASFCLYEAKRRSPWLRAGQGAGQSPSRAIAVGSPASLLT